MNILGISGSPRTEGNTAYSVHYALDILSGEGFDSRYISLAEKNIHPCIGCWRCANTFKCRFDDDMKEILDAMRWADGVIIGSPVYFGLVSGQLKVMMDRCVPLRPSYKLPLAMAGKIGAAIACAGFRNGGQETTLQCIHIFLMQQSMMVVNDGPPFSHAGGAIAGEAIEDVLGLQTIKSLSRHMSAILKQKK